MVIGSYGGARGKAAYVSSKHGVMGLVKVAALEGAAHGLTVNLIAPGWMDTEMLRGQLSDQAASLGMSASEVVPHLRETAAWWSVGRRRGGGGRCRVSCQPFSVRHQRESIRVDLGAGATA